MRQDATAPAAPIDRPGGARAAAIVSFDLDAEAVVLTADRGFGYGSSLMDSDVRPG